MILTGAAFIHIEYLRMFIQEVPADVKRKIDNVTNCEDIGMNFLVSGHCGCSGVFRVKGVEDITQLESESNNTGLQFRSEHYKDRSQCVTLFMKLFGSFPLREVECMY